MRKSYEQKYHRLEERHWWFVARREMICNLVRRLDRSARVLEVGCSGGVLIDSLRQQGLSDVYGVDISAEAAALCRRRGIPGVFVTDGGRLALGAEEFDVVIASDVLEHIDGEHLALREWHRILRPGGTLVVFVPAFNFMWSAHDEINRHYRRYSKRALVRALEKAHFAVERSSYWNLALFFPASAVRLCQRLFRQNAREKQDQLYEFSPLISRALTCLLRAENWVLRSLSFPVGVSVFAVAHKVGSAGRCQPVVSPQEPHVGQAQGATGCTS